jgi:exodeoxyribonuclease VII large subunit
MKRAVDQIMKSKKTCLHNHGERLRALDPLQVLTRGYALVFDRDELPVRSAYGVREGQSLRIIFYDGDADCSVLKVRMKEG